MRRPIRTHDVEPRTTTDRLVFILAFVAGVVGGVFLKITGTHPFLAASFSGAVLIGYALILWVSGRLRLDPESIGDNCYYLGFLFTLASLSITLYQVASPAAGATRMVVLPDVISGFGVALSSTIVGVFLRVLMMQMRPNFVAAENEARTELSSATREFKNQLAASTVELKSFAVESIQRNHEREEKIRAMTEKFIKDAYEKMAESQAEFMKKAEESIAETVKAMSKEIGRSFDITAKSMGGSVKTLDDSVYSLQQTVGDLGSSVENSAKYIGGFTADLERYGEHTISVMKAIADGTVATDKSFKKFTSNLSRAATKVESKTIPALESFEERLAKLPASPPLPPSKGKRVLRERGGINKAGRDDHDIEVADTTEASECGAE